MKNNSQEIWILEEISVKREKHTSFNKRIYMPNPSFIFGLVYVFFAVVVPIIFILCTLLLLAKAFAAL